jgi:hypothetical protein
VVAVLGATLLYSPSIYAVSFQPVSPDELKMTQESHAPGAAAVILYRQVDRDDNGLTPHEDNYLRIKILTKAGAKYAAIEIPFAKGNENIVHINARTIKPDGSIVAFDGPVVEKPLVPKKQLKDMAKTFTLPGVEVGSIIEYYYTIDYPPHNVIGVGNTAVVSSLMPETGAAQPIRAAARIDARASDMDREGSRTLSTIGQGGIDSHWILSQELFTKSAKFTLKPYEPSSSSNLQMEVRQSWQLLPPGTAPPVQGSDHIVRLETSNVPAFHQEEYAPPDNELKARVDFIYSLEPLDSDANRYWKKVGKDLNGRLEAFLGKKSTMEAAAGQIVSPGDSPETKLRKLYARVQQMRNTSYQPQLAEPESKSEKAAANVEELWKRGYGDGPSLTWLYLALVRAAGFEAHGVWVPERDQYFFNPQLQDRSRLNANLVVIKLEGKDVYCDPGSRFTPFGLLPWPKTAVSGLRLDKDGGSWIKTPLPESSASRVERKAQLQLSATTGDLEGKLTVTFTGLEAAGRRAEAAAQDEIGRKKALEDEVKQDIPAPSEVELTNAPDWNDAAQPLVAEFKLKVPAWVSKGPGPHVFLVGLFGAKEKHVFESEQRTHAICFDFPAEKADDVTLELPPGWRVVRMPSEQNLDGHVVKYNLKVENGKESVHLARSLKVDLLMLDTSYYEALRGFFEDVRISDQNQVAVQPGPGAAAAN